MAYKGSGGILPLNNLGQPKCFRKEINFFPLLGFKPWIVQSPQASHYIYYAIPAPEGKEGKTA